MDKQMCDGCGEDVEVSQFVEVPTVHGDGGTFCAKCRDEAAEVPPEAEFEGSSYDEVYGDPVEEAFMREVR